MITLGKMTAEIVSIGDEITSGSIVDTNSAFLSRELAELGVRTLYHTTVGDDLDAMTDVFRSAILRSNLIIVTGGLGPTEDDLTRQAVAKVAGVELVQDQESIDHIRHLFLTRQRPMPDSNFIQSYFPAGSEVIFNPNGTAPGFLIDFDRSKLGKEGAVLPPSGNQEKNESAVDFGPAVRLMTFPGVPAEMKEMWRLSGRSLADGFVVRRLGKRRHIQTRSIHCFGAGESDIESRLPHLIDRNHVPRVGITASAGIITLRIIAEGTDYAECRRQLEETAAIIYDKVGEFVFGEGNQTLASILADRLLREKKKIGVIEWGTRGVLSGKIDHRVFAGGVVDSDDRPITKLLGLSPDATPESILRAFAKKIGADGVVAVGRYPSPEELEKPETARVAVYALANDRFSHASFVYGLHPSIIDTLFADRALNLFRKTLPADIPLSR